MTIKAFWIQEESEVYAGHSLEEILLYFFNKEEKYEILKDHLYGEIGLNNIFKVKDENTGIVSTKTIKELIEETKSFPDLLFTSYN